MKWTIFFDAIQLIIDCCGLMTKWNERYSQKGGENYYLVVVWWQNEMNDICRGARVKHPSVVVWWQNEMNDIVSN